MIADPGGAGAVVWGDALPAWGVEVRFVGRDRTARPDRAEQLARLTAGAEPGPRAAWATQVHSARVLEVGAGDGREREPIGSLGEGDALVTATTGVALGVVTADCLPVLIAGRHAVAAAHAGWRGLAAGILPASVAALRRALPNSEGIVAWIGPAIGRCCYEVGSEVVEAVARGAGVDPATLATPGPRGRPLLDLVAAARAQLLAAHVAAASIRVLDLCTRCQADRLWSYRRDGPGTGRNHAWIWRSWTATGDGADPGPGHRQPV